MAAGTDGVHILDISDPASPRSVGGWNSPGLTEGIALDGTALFVADGPFGLQIVDVSDPSAPTHARIRARHRHLRIDKLRGTITEDQWREHHERWQEELDELAAKRTSATSKEELRRRLRTPFELAQRALDLYLTRNAAERAEPLKTLGSNYTVKDGTVVLSMRSTFDALQQAQQSRDWLGGRDGYCDPRDCRLKRTTWR